MDERLTFEDRKRVWKQDWDNFTWKASIKAKAVGNWIRQNPREAAAIGIAALTSTTKIVGSVSKAKAARDSRYIAERTFYDNRNQVRFETRRKLSNKERMEVAHRMDQGESCYDILRDMRAI